MIHVVLPKAGRPSWLNYLPTPTRVFVTNMVFKQAADVERPVNVRVAGEHWER